MSNLNCTIAAIAYDLPKHDIEDLADWEGEGDEAPCYADRVNDILNVATHLDPLLSKYCANGTDEVDAYGTLDNVTKMMVEKYKSTRSYRLTDKELRACLDWHNPEKRRIMDPDAILKDIRQLVNHIQNGVLLTPSNLRHAAEELVEKFHNLDQWVVSGGFLPDDWRGRDIGKYAPPRPPEDRHPTHLEISPTMFCVMLAERLGSVRYSELEGLYATTPSLVSSWLWWYEQAAIAVDQHARSYALIGDDPDRFWDKYVLDVVATHLKKATELPRNVAELLDVAIDRALKDKDAESAL